MELPSTAYNLAPIGAWFPPFIEAAIAASIFYMAIENIIGAKVSQRWIITGLFGLVRGFGFADVLKEQLQFAGSYLLISPFADRKKALAAARSQCSLSITSTRAPARSTTTHPNVCLVDVPASADFALSSPTQVFTQCRGKFGFPITHRLIAEDEPADQEHFGQIP